MQRFWDKVTKGDECWTWSAYKEKAGYGMFGYERRWQMAHRVSWMLANGPIPNGLEVCHRCDNRACVRPDHLFLGSHAENMADAAKKKRMVTSTGEDNHQHKLTERDIPYIRELAKIGFSQRELGRMYGVHQQVVYAVIHRKAWAHVP